MKALYGTLFFIGFILCTASGSAITEIDASTVNLFITGIFGCLLMYFAGKKAGWLYER